MKIRYVLMIGIAGLATWSAGTGAVRASELLYAGAGFMVGTQSLTDTFSVPTAGTLTVTLADVAWPQPLASLDVLMSSASGVLGPEMGAGTSMFNVAAGHYTASLFGVAQGALNAGVYSLEIQFQPGGSGGTPVPLPTSIALLLSGLGLLAWQRRSAAG